jgi:GNAT superfamily N-acetyltransferase
VAEERNDEATEGSTQTAYVIVFEEEPAASDLKSLSDGLAEFNRQHAGDDGHRRLAFFLRNPDGAMVGGIYGITFWGWFSVELLWVEEHLRGLGYGKRLLAAAEQEAVRRGCSHAFLDTFDFQAPSFYTRRGYEIFGKLANLPPGHVRYYLTKQLQRTPEADA